MPLSLRVVYPTEGASIAAVESTFVFGNVSDPKARLTIDGRDVTVYRTGGFLAYVALAPGATTLRVVARRGDDSTLVARHLTVAEAPQTPPVFPFTVDARAAEPSEDRELQPGDVVSVRVRASPGAHAWFDLAGRHFPLTEAPDTRPDDPRVEAFTDGVSHADTVHSGIYTGAYVIQPDDSLAAAHVVVHLVAESGADTARVVTAASLTTLDTRTPRVVEFVDSLTVGRTAPAGGYSLFVPRGVRAWCTGAHAAWFRVRCADGLAVWVPRVSVRILPAGTSIPRPRVGTIRVDEGARASRVTVTVVPPVPYRIEEDIDPGRLRVSLYGAVADVDWIHYSRGEAAGDSTGAYIPLVSWSQPASEIVQLEIHLAARRPWGYAASYDGTTFTLVARRPPAPQVDRKKGTLKKTPSPLAGWRIAVDAGHAPDTGASGPTGVLERDMTLAISRELGARLRARGADVFFTRPDSSGVPLAERPRIAVAGEADLLLSVHLNALPDGVNPFLHRGTSVYFYYPHSERLAARVHEALRAQLGLPDFGLYYGNLALTRPPQMPAILTESTFLMHPEEEEALRDGSRRRQIADAIAAGVEAFVGEQSWSAALVPAPALDGTHHTP